ncbi:MAG: MOSC domain-containing protein [Chloroflexi bacterium]|nr:MOSC domain-containing protein [Chloroflexota bacterium]
MLKQQAGIANRTEWPLGVVVGIYTAERAGAPPQLQASVQVTPGVGIEGDRYATRQGHWSDPKWLDQELTLIEAETAEDLGIPAELLRRNIVLRGVSLDGLIGATFQIGDAVLLGVRPCDPCKYIETLLERPGLLKALVTRGGLRVRILRGGRISLGQSIEVLAADPT